MRLNGLDLCACDIRWHDKHIVVSQPAVIAIVFVEALPFIATYTVTH